MKNIEKYAYCMNFATGGQMLPDFHNEILQIDSFIATTQSFNELENPSSISISLKNEFEIPFSTQLYSYIDEKFLEKHSFADRKQILQKLAKVVSNIMQKNICIICWNSSNVILDTLECNLKHNSIEFDSQKAFNYTYMIDVKRLVEIFLENDMKMQSYSLDSACFCIEKRLNENFSLNDFESKWTNKKHIPELHCKTTNQQILFILKYIMQKMNVTSFYNIAMFLHEPHLMKKMPFGKYKNMTFDKIMEIDVSYLHWLRRQSSTIENKDLVFTIDQLMNK